MNNATEGSIRAVIDQTVRPYIERDGGAITLRKFEDGVVYVALTGACEGCSASDITLKTGVERALRRAFREVRSVVLVE